MNKLNEVLKKRVEELGGNQAEIARSINFSSQRFGKYLKGRRIPVELLTAWKKRYNEDLQVIAETFDEKNVSRETRQINMPLLSDRDIIEAPNYIGMHKRVYNSLEKSLEMFQKLAIDAQRNANDLTQILAGRSGPGSGPPQG